MHTYSDEGIILRRHNFGEADRILSVFTKQYGKITVLAKSVRKPESRKRGHIEIFSKIKFIASKSSGFDLITEIEELDNFSEIRRSLKKISLAYYFCEVAAKISHEWETLPYLYDAISVSLEKLKYTNKLKDLRLEFIFGLLTNLGYWPVNKKMDDPDGLLSEVIEKQLHSKRVGTLIAS